MRKALRAPAKFAGAGSLLPALVLSPQGNAQSQAAPQASAAGKTPFLTWLDSEGIPVHRGFEVEDVAKVAVGPWRRYGVKGAMVYLDGAEGVTTGIVWEIAPG